LVYLKFLFLLKHIYITLQNITQDRAFKLGSKKFSRMAIEF